jgi:hypothetical protein
MLWPPLDMGFIARFDRSQAKPTVVGAPCMGARGGYMGPPYVSSLDMGSIARFCGPRGSGP